jgi:Na+-transporting NADH:ubiquinone oxidoreductase subunit NqrF
VSAQNLAQAGDALVVRLASRRISIHQICSGEREAFRIFNQRIDFYLTLNTAEWNLQVISNRKIAAFVVYLRVRKLPFSLPNTTDTC